MDLVIYDTNEFFLRHKQALIRYMQILRKCGEYIQLDVVAIDKKEVEEEEKELVSFKVFFSAGLIFRNQSV